MNFCKETVGGEIVDRDRNHEPACIILFTLRYGRTKVRPYVIENVVCQAGFLDISGCAEQPASSGQRLRDFGDDSWGAENRELRAERGEQVTAMTLSPMIGMDGDLVDEATGRPLCADQNADRVGAREGDHAAAAPDLKVADRPLERGRGHWRLVGKVRRPAAIQRADEKLDVVRAAEAVGAHGRLPTPNSQLPTFKTSGQMRGGCTQRAPLGIGSWDLAS